MYLSKSDRKRGTTRVGGCLVAVALVLPSPGSLAHAQDTFFEPEPVECLPVEENRTYETAVDNVEAGDTVRLYFRRLNPLGEFYYVQMASAGGDRYWTTFPKAKEEEQSELSDGWWDSLKTRDWVEGRDRNWLEDLLEEQKQEAAEYYVAVFNPAGELKERSKVLMTSVKKDGCTEPMDPKQQGWANNLTIGETSAVQRNQEVYHWLCAGIVTRINPEDVRRPDQYCRACAAGFLFWVPPVAGAATIAIIGGGLINSTSTPVEATPRQP